MVQTNAGNLADPVVMLKMNLSTVRSIEIETRKISVHSFEITAIEMPKINFEIMCSKGTYIRSIAHDFGTAIKSGGHLSKLCRTAIGNYKLQGALDIISFEKQLNN